MLQLHSKSVFGEIVQRNFEILILNKLVQLFCIPRKFLIARKEKFFLEYCANARKIQAGLDVQSFTRLETFSQSVSPSKFGDLQVTLAACGIFMANQFRLQILTCKPNLTDNEYISILHLSNLLLKCGKTFVKI